MIGNNLICFYREIVCRKSFYVPIILFAIIGYSFSIYNRTIGIDDMFRHLTLEHGLTGRWGGQITFNLLGLTVLDPFIDRFLAILFLTLAAILFCYVLYSVNNIKEILPYTLTVSIFITYPLINEIWEYTTANWTTGSDLCLVTIAFLVLRTQKPLTQKFLLAGVLMVIPITTYEISIFYYITLVFIIIFYEMIYNNDKQLSYICILKNAFVYLFPLLIALAIRVFVTLLIKTTYASPFNYDLGNTHITWMNYDFFPTLKGLLVSNFLNYVVCGLVYFPITIFVLYLALFLILLFRNKENNSKMLLMGVLILFSLFGQAVLQGDVLAYRHTISITLFVAFVTYLLCISVNIQWRKYVYILFFFLCWHQAVYLNRIFGLNNLRSDNELSTLRFLGYRLTSEYKGKPVVFVGEYQKGSWILSKVSADVTNLNGRLFFSVCNLLGAKKEVPFKYIGTNVNNATFEYYQIEEILKFCGFDIDVIPQTGYEMNDAMAEKLFKEATLIAKRNKLKPFQIFDNEHYLIVNLGGLDSQKAIW